MNFRAASKAAFSEIEGRRGMSKKILSFGIKYLDESTGGIFPADLVLIGAPSGVGKTQLCCNMAIANISKGRDVHYIALEASENEIERRMKYQILTDLFYKKSIRPKISHSLTYRNWYLGLLIDDLEDLEKETAAIFERDFSNIFLYYKSGDYGVDDFVKQVMSIAHKTEMIIVDHIHYFDFDDENENRAIKKIAKTARTLALELNKPIILIGHLRKKDRMSNEIVAGLEEFHGSSDLYKIASKVVTVAPGSKVINHPSAYETYFRVPKDRIDGSATRFSARCVFNAARGTYEPEYNIGFANQSRDVGFKELDRDLRPEWAKSVGRPMGVGDDDLNNAFGKPEVSPNPRRSKPVHNHADSVVRDGVGVRFV